MRVCVNEVLLY